MVPLLGTEFVPKGDYSETTLNFQTPVGTSLESTALKAQQVEAIVREFPEVQYTLTEADQTLTVPFYFLANNHLKVIKRGTSETVLTLTTHYTVTGVGDEDGGEVVLTGVATAIGDIITIMRSVPATQLVDYVYNDKFPAQTHEKALDKLTMLIQQLEDINYGALHFEDTEVLSGLLLLAERKGKGLYFDATTGAPAFFDITGMVGPSFSSLTYAASVALTFAAQAKVHELTLGGNITFTASGYTQGREIRINITADGTSRTFTFPSAWKWLCGKPTGIVAGKVGVLSLTCRTGVESGVIAVWAVEG